MSRVAGLTGLVAGTLRSGTLLRLASSMGAAIAARLGLLLLAVLIGRSFGPQDYGAFTFATSMALLLAQVGAMGWPTLMNRLIPQFTHAADWARLRGLTDAGDWLILATSLASILILVALWAAGGELAGSFLLGAVLVFPFSLAILRRQQLAALRLPAVGLLFDQGLGALIAVAVLFFVGVESILQAVVLFGGAILAGNLYTTLLVRRRLPAEIRTAPRTIELRAWMAIALPILVGMSSKLIMNKADVLMLAPLAGLEESGLYGAAFRITFLLTFPQVVVMSVVTPMIAEAFAKGRPQHVGRLMRRALLFAAATAIPFALVMMVVPGPILTLLFGEAFAPAAPALALLAFGQMATGLAVPLQAGLTMSGQERSFGAVNLGGLALHVALNLVLIPRYGAMGAATATATVSTGIALGLFYFNRAVLFGKQASDVR